MKAQIRKIARMIAGWPVIGRLVRIAVAVIRLPEFRAEYMDLSHRQHVFEMEINHRQNLVETEKLPAMVNALSEINRQLTDAYLDLNHRLHILEAETLPALFHDSDNLVKSVPVALRKITRDLIAVNTNLESLSRALERGGLIEGEAIGVTRNSDIRHGLEIEEIKSGRLR
jgi:hypothetical protein